MNCNWQNTKQSKTKQKHKQNETKTKQNKEQKQNKTKQSKVHFWQYTCRNAENEDMDPFSRSPVPSLVPSPRASPTHLEASIEGGVLQTPPSDDLSIYTNHYEML